ncbi:MAG: macro domain-containing protein [Gemmataceae bacterium]|nr:macro domain-containing protein [Gemmataceae bacterium]MCI0740615.1 macro domain-containing protein [Gemmataceae bacterium]
MLPQFTRTGPKHGLKSIAFPAISTGAYRFPMDRAACIALNEIMAFLDGNKEFEKVILVCFGHDTYQSYLKAWKKSEPRPQGSG